jgi:hypothetical protein
MIFLSPTKEVVILKKFIVSVIALIFASSTFLVSENKAHAATYDGDSPVLSGCANDAYTARSATLASGSIIELRYSPSCRTVWARITNPVVDDNNNYSFAIVTRNSDGHTYSCLVPTGAKSCYTPMLNDAGVTSYAKGIYGTYVPEREYTATTGSY